MKWLKSSTGKAAAQGSILPGCACEYRTSAPDWIHGIRSPELDFAACYFALGLIFWSARRTIAEGRFAGAAAARSWPDSVEGTPDNAQIKRPII